jgi:hypothetical protein
MSSIDFVEIAQKGGLPVVETGHVKVQKAVASEPLDSARLRVFSRRTPGQPTFTFSRMTFIFALVRRLARPDSEFRNVLAHFSGNCPHEAPQILFKAPHGNADHLEHLHFRSSHDLERHWAATIDDALLISAEGPRSDLMKLLDSILDEWSSAKSPSVATDKGAHSSRPLHSAMSFCPGTGPMGNALRKWLAPGPEATSERN